MDNLPLGNDSDADIARDIAAVQRIDAVPSILRLICKNTGMGFAAVARVTDETWTACAVQGEVNFGLVAGDQLELHTTLCFESRAARASIVIDNFGKGPVYHGHHTARIYNSAAIFPCRSCLPTAATSVICARSIRPRPRCRTNAKTPAWRGGVSGAGAGARRKRRTGADRGERRQRDRARCVGPGLRAFLAAAHQQARRRAWAWPLYLQADRPRAWRHAGRQLVCARGHTLCREIAHRRVRARKALSG